MLEIPRIFVHDPSKCYKFLGSLGTIQWICFVMWLECPQNPRKFVTCPARMLEIPRIFVHDPSKCYKFLGNLEILLSWNLPGKTAFWTIFRKFSPSPTPSKTQILLILSFRRLWASVAFLSLSARLFLRQGEWHSSSYVCGIPALLNGPERPGMNLTRKRKGEWHSSSYVCEIPALLNGPERPGINLTLFAARWVTFFFT